MSTREGLEAAPRSLSVCVTVALEHRSPRGDQLATGDLSPAGATLAAWNSGEVRENYTQKQQERLERLKSMNQRFRSPSNLAELENVPAFKRRNISLDDTPHSSESSVTKFEVKEDGDTDENGNKRGGLSDNNEFLHKSVD